MTSRTTPRTTPTWPISIAVALVGLAQSGLLVALPLLAARTGLTLSQWAGLILLGSLLFAVGSPFWGRVADRSGPRLVAVQAVLGYAACFGLIGVAVGLADAGRLSSGALLALVGCARILYGATASGLVPACQRWSLALHAPERRVAALARVSLGLSAGRVAGPLLASACLAASLQALFVALPLAALLVLALIATRARPVIAPPPASTTPAWLPRGEQAPYLLAAVLVALSVSLMQLGLPATLQATLAVGPERASSMLGLLLFLGALATATVQIGVIRIQQVGELKLLAAGATALVIGYAVLVQAGIPAWFVVGAIAAHAGAAGAVPAYIALATRGRDQGTCAGFLATAHTLGYGLALLAVHASKPEGLLAVALSAALLLAGLISAIAWWHQRAQTAGAGDRSANPPLCSDASESPTGKP